MWLDKIIYLKDVDKKTAPKNKKGQMIDIASQTTMQFIYKLVTFTEPIALVNIYPMANTVEFFFGARHQDGEGDGT